MVHAESGRDLPAGTLETTPLIVGILGISIPVSLLALAATGGSVVVLVLAVLAMFAVGACTLTFVLRLAGEGHEPHDGQAAE
jgi:hypothetical protein